MNIVLVFLQALLAVGALWFILSFIDNLCARRPIPWWIILFTSLLVVFWGYLEYYL